MTLGNIYYLNEIGAKKNQEDYIWPAPGNASLNDRVFIVCDGVGGSQNGEIASRIVSESVGNALLKAAPAKIGIPFINELLAEAKTKLLTYAKNQNLNLDMATTFTLLAFVNERAFVSWCGDSRVYHMRHGEVRSKTEDHSLVSSLVKTGEITEKEALNHPQKNIILKAIRADDSEPEAEGYWIDDVQSGDYFMLCTDGLLENIGDRDLKFLLNQNDKGSIDLVQSFQQFCYGKTNDNYSMYLIKIGTASHPTNRIRIRTLLFVLVTFLAAGSIILTKIYYAKRKPIDVVVPVNREKDTSDSTDDLNKDSAKSSTVPQAPIVPVDSRSESTRPTQSKFAGRTTDSARNYRDSSHKSSASLNKQDSANGLK